MGDPGFELFDAPEVEELPVAGPLGPGPTIHYGVTRWGVTDEAGVAWICENLDGWADMPESNAPILDRTFDHGAWTGQGWFRARMLTLTGVLDAANRFDLAAVLNVLRGQQAAALDDYAVLTVDEVDGSKHLDVRAANPRLTVEYLTMTAARVVAELFAPWPVKESAHETAVTAGVQRGQGWTYPRLRGTRVYPSRGSTGDLHLVNGGTAPTRLRFVIRGPCTRPSVICGARRLTFAITLGANETLTVDVDTHSILLNQTANRRYVLTPDSSWFNLDPGENIVQYRKDSGAGSLTVYWSSGWW